MPDNNYNYGAAYVMNSDKVSVDTDEGASKLYREGLEFPTRVKTGPITEDMPNLKTSVIAVVRQSTDENFSNANTATTDDGT